MTDNPAPPAPRILLTRPRAASERFAADLRSALGPVEVVIVPVMEIVPLGRGVDLDGVSALIFTSAAGVEVFGDLSPDRTLPAWCVGDRTAEAARAIGLKATSAGGDANAMVELMTAARPSGRLLHLRGAHTRGDVAGRLVDAGLRAESQEIYDQVAMPPGPEMAAALTHTGPVIVPLFSPRSARLFMEAAGEAEILPVALSEAVRDALPEPLARRAEIADTPDAAAMIRAISSVISP